MALGPGQTLQGPSIDASGLAPKTQDVGLIMGADQASPTTMVLKYLRERGYQPTTDNVRRALEANARDPGVIPGLTGDRAATPQEDQAAMAAARGSGGGGGNTSAAPVQTAPPTAGTGGTFGTGQSPVEGGPLPPSADSTNTPPAPSIDNGTLAKGLLLGIPAAALLGGGAALYANRGQRAPGDVVPPMPDPGAGVATGAPPNSTSDVDLFPPGSARTQVNPQADTGVPASVLDQATAPAELRTLNPIARPGSMDLTPPRGPVTSVVRPMPPLRGGRGIVPNVQVNPAAAAEIGRVLRGFRE